MYSNEPSVKHQLRRRIDDLSEGYQKLDRHSRKPDDLWAVKVYEKLLQRDQRMYRALFGEVA
ncbi:MAG: hypothetical protein OQK78_06880 [Gammaproteobacteria bacterium]|nr:hypothetical protein [Gammaproteobacteria bacterium]